MADGMKHSGSRMAAPTDTVSFPITLRHDHRLVFTRDVFAPENRVLEISQITQGLKAIAKELAVPVIALSQLSRAVESREDKRPQLRDIARSSGPRRACDAALLIYRLGRLPSDRSSIVQVRLGEAFG